MEINDLRENKAPFFTTKSKKRDEVETEPDGPKNKAWRAIRRPPGKVWALAFLLQPSAFVPVPLQNVKEQAPGRHYEAIIPHYGGITAFILMRAKFPTRGTDANKASHVFLENPISSGPVSF
jgi:hypothetical protein